MAHRHPILRNPRPFSIQSWQGGKKPSRSGGQTDHTPASDGRDIEFFNNITMNAGSGWKRLAEAILSVPLIRR
jgi:hypothetical protein